jgi:hypothetical protein
MFGLMHVFMIISRICLHPTFTRFGIQIESVVNGVFCTLALCEGICFSC